MEGRQKFFIYLVCGALIYTWLGLPGVGYVLYSFQYVFEGAHYMDARHLEPFSQRGLISDLNAELPVDMMANR